MKCILNEILKELIYIAKYDDKLNTLLDQLNDSSDISYRFSSDSEANASELRENLWEMFHHYYVDNDVLIMMFW